jgi:hypothetical protein
VTIPVAPGVRVLLVLTKTLALEKIIVIFLLVLAMIPGFYLKSIYITPLFFFSVVPSCGPSDPCSSCLSQSDCGSSGHSGCVYDATSHTCMEIPFNLIFCSLPFHFNILVVQLLRHPALHVMLLRVIAMTTMPIATILHRHAPA